MIHGHYNNNSTMKVAAIRPPLLLLWLIVGSSFPWIAAGASQSSNYALSKDYTYYPGNGVNPLVRQPLYYNDAGNVLADLGSFQYLYIQYHSCAYVQ